MYNSCFILGGLQWHPAEVFLIFWPIWEREYYRTPLLIWCVQMMKHSNMQRVWTSARTSLVLLRGPQPPSSTGCRTVWSLTPSAVRPGSSRLFISYLFKDSGFSCGGKYLKMQTCVNVSFSFPVEFTPGGSFLNLNSSSIATSSPNLLFESSTSATSVSVKMIRCIFSSEFH